MENSNRLTSMEIDVLGEIGNIGSGNAATALSEMLGHPINIDVPEVIILDYDNMMKPIESIDDLDDMDRSAIVEIGNILMGSYVNAVAQLTGLHIDISVPSHTINMAGAILSVPLVSVAEEYDYIVMIKANFLIEDKRVSGDIFMVLDMGSLKKMLTNLGVE